MNLELFFEPLEEDVFDHQTGARTVGEDIRIFGKEQFDWKSADIVIFSCIHPEEETDAINHFDEARKVFYTFKKGVNPVFVADLGYLKPGPTDEDTKARFQEAVNSFVSMGILPIVLGADHGYTYTQYLGYESLHKPVSLAIIDAFFDIENFDATLNRQNHIQHIITHKPNFLMSYAHLAYQSYLVDQDVLRIFEKLNFEKYRIGEIRENFKLMEPVLRMCDLVSFDLAAIRKSDTPSSLASQPFGLTGEEACQLSWYAGIADNLTSFGIYGVDQGTMPDENTSYVVATMLWYFIEGYTHRNDDLDFEGAHYTKFVVNYNNAPHRLAFYKSKNTGKWWMKVSDTHIVPCSYEDYQTAANGELPERWVRFSANLD